MAEVLTKLTVSFPEPAARHVAAAEHDWWFTVFGADGPELETNTATILEAVKDFYTLTNGTVTTAPTGHAMPSAYMANYLTPPSYRGVAIDQTTGHEVPGTVIEGSWSGWNFNRITAVNDLPPEVALCLSWNSVFTGLTGRHKARARGRVFLGPWSIAALSSTGGHHPNTGLTDAIIANYGRMQAAISAIATSPLCSQVIYSRVDHTPRAVVAGWIDDEWDTQRRRGGFTGLEAVRKPWS